MAKYINADEVIEKLRDIDGKGLKADIYSLVALVTAMNESIVRCKDCKHAEYDISCDEYECMATGCGLCYDGDFYCADAERKEDSNE